MPPIQPGAIVHGFCNGFFGRDHYQCMVTEMVAPDWIVFRGLRDYKPVMLYLEPGIDWAKMLAEWRADRSYCGEDAPNWGLANGRLTPCARID